MIPDDTKIADVDFGDSRIATRIKSASAWEKWETAGDLRAATDRQILSVPNIGRKCLSAIRDTLGPGRKS